jgi:hypothetical protein
MAYQTKRKPDSAATPDHKQSKKQKFSKTPRDGAKPARDSKPPKKVWDNKHENAPKRPPFAKEPEEDDEEASDFEGLSDNEEGGVKIDSDIDAKPAKGGDAGNNG